MNSVMMSLLFRANQMKYALAIVKWAYAKI